METPSRVATSAAGIGVAAGIIFVGVPLGTWLGWLDPAAFRVFLLGGVLPGVLALVLGLIALWRTRASAHRFGRERAQLGTAIGLGIVVTVLASAGCALGLPPINDISTDTANPPRFVHAPSLSGQDMAYDPERFAAPTREAYPDLTAIELAMTPAAAFARVELAAGDLGWEITHRDPSAGILEATETSSVFRFVDDVVVRVRPSPEGSRVDVRSRSRIGRSDLGANAERIRRLRDALTD